MTSLRKIHGCPASQRCAPRAETTAVSRLESRSGMAQGIGLGGVSSGGKCGVARPVRSMYSSRPFRNRSPFGAFKWRYFCDTAELTVGYDGVTIRSFSMTFSVVDAV